MQTRENEIRGETANRDMQAIKISIKVLFHPEVDKLDVIHNKLGHNFEQKLSRIFYLVTEKDLDVYLFIDEYDNFANEVLMVPKQKTQQETEAQRQRYTGLV